MIASDIREILDMLLERSKRREVNWVETKDMVGMVVDKSGEDYVVALPNSSINIWRSSKPDKVVGNILNSEGKVVLGFSANEADPDFPFLEELLSWAKRSALKADETLSEIKRALADKGRVGSNPKKDDEIPF
jgi:hypothetical protein